MLGEALASTKGTAAVAVTGFSAGAAHLLNLIPDDIGKITVLLSVIMMLLTIYLKWRRGLVEIRMLENDLYLQDKKIEKMEKDTGEDDNV